MFSQRRVATFYYLRIIAILSNLSGGFYVIAMYPPRERAMLNIFIDTVMIYKLIAEFFQALIPICICVVLPALIVWLIGRVKQNETNRKAEIMLKALDNGAKIDSDFFRAQSNSKTIKERLLSRLTGACITGLLGVAFLAVAIYAGCKLDWSSNDDVIILLYLLGGILLAVGLALLVVYFIGRKMLAKEIAAEEKQITEGK